jgi:3-hydroxyisobutyrate dehydrogenase-like beta-hydroxyacid dehydrogenase
MHVSVLGYGEAGRRLAADLVAAGIKVSAFDVRRVEPADGVVLASSIAEAVEGTDLVLSLTTSAGSVAAARGAAGHLDPATVYADMNAASPERKAEVGAELGAGLYVDVAILAPIPRAGMRTPVLACGPGAARFVELLEPLGASIDVIEGEPGDATARKLLRSIFMKSLATSILEALTAGRATGCEEWVRDQVVAELGAGGEALVDRLVNGTYQHARRRLHEMEDTRDYARQLKTPHEMTLASISWLSAIDRGERQQLRTLES